MKIKRVLLALSFALSIILIFCFLLIGINAYRVSPNRYYLQLNIMHFLKNGFPTKIYPTRTIFLDEDPAYLFEKLIAPEEMDKITDDTYIYKDGFFKMTFTWSSDIDYKKHRIPTTTDKKIAIGDDTVVYSMKEWKYRFFSDGYVSSLRYYKTPFYAEATIVCNNPKNEKKISKGIESFIEHMHSCFNS